MVLSPFRAFFHLISKASLTLYHKKQEKSTFFGEFSKKTSTNCKIPLTKDNEYGIIVVGLWRLTLLTSFVGMPPYHFANIFGGCNHV
jgi:hypothetical protein